MGCSKNVYCPLCAVGFCARWPSPPAAANRHIHTPRLTTPARHPTMAAGQGRAGQALRVPVGRPPRQPRLPRHAQHWRLPPPPPALGPAQARCAYEWLGGCVSGLCDWALGSHATPLFVDIAPTPDTHTPITPPLTHRRSKITRKRAFPRRRRSPSTSSWARTTWTSGWRTASASLTTWRKGKRPVAAASFAFRQAQARGCVCMGSVGNDGGPLPPESPLTIPTHATRDPSPVGYTIEGQEASAAAATASSEEGGESGRRTIDGCIVGRRSTRERGSRYFPPRSSFRPPPPPPQLPRIATNRPPQTRPAGWTTRRCRRRSRSATPPTTSTTPPRRSRPWWVGGCFHTRTHTRTDKEGRREGANPTVCGGSCVSRGMQPAPPPSILARTPPTGTLLTDLTTPPTPSPVKQNRWRR